MCDKNIFKYKRLFKKQLNKLNTISKLKKVVINNLICHVTLDRLVLIVYIVLNYNLIYKSV